MEMIVAALEPLDRPARKRVLRWAWARHIPPTIFDRPAELEGVNDGDD